MALCLARDEFEGLYVDCIEPSQDEFERIAGHLGNDMGDESNARLS